MIHLIVKDGLGNQMFQYAFARQLQLRYEKELGQKECIAINPFYVDNVHAKDNDIRSLSLQHFVLNRDVWFVPLVRQRSSLTRFKLKAAYSSGLKELIRWRLFGKKEDTATIFERRAEHGIYYTYFPYTVCPVRLSSARDKYIFGFFQSEQYFLDMAHQLRSEFVVKDAVLPQNRSVYEAIRTSQAVCLHIRRGDYLNPRWKSLNICDFEYYNNAINFILSKVEHPHFFIFSNSHEDIEWIKNNYRFFNYQDDRVLELTYVDHENPDYEELRLMQHCKYFIISNSTYSWWAAYLSDYRNKIVCAPKRWNLAADNDRNIYMDNWTII